MARRTLAAFLLAATLLPIGERRAQAHPHILANVRAEIIWDDGGKISAIRQVWTYDAAYSAFLLRDLAKKGSAPSSTDLANLARTQLNAFAEYGYFSSAVADGLPVGWGDATGEATFESDGAISIAFALPVRLQEPLRERLALEIIDPKFFAYFTMAADAAPVALRNAPEGCRVAIAGPSPIDLKRPAGIAKIFWDALDGSADAARHFVNRITVTC